MARRVIAVLAAATAVALPRVLDELSRLATTRAAAELGGPPAVPFSTWVLVSCVLTTALAGLAVVRFGRRGLLFVTLVVVAHSIAATADFARRVDLGAAHPDAVSHIESPEGSVRGGLRLLAERGRLGLLVLPFQALVLVGVAVYVLRGEAWVPIVVGRGVALAIASGGGLLALAAIAAWSAGSLSALSSDELVVIGHGVALAFALRVGPRPASFGSVAALAGIFSLFALGFGLVHGWKTTRSLCVAAGSGAYDRATSARALTRARSRLASPLGWSAAHVPSVQSACEAAARDLGS